MSVFDMANFSIVTVTHQLSPKQDRTMFGSVFLCEPNPEKKHLIFFMFGSDVYPFFLGCVPAEQPLSCGGFVR